MFKVGEKGVYPAYGVVTIIGVEEKEIVGTKKSFYILKVIESDVTLMVPIDNAQSVGLRPVVSKRNVPKIYNILGTKKKATNNVNGNTSWNKRYREYAEKLKSGDIFEVAHVLREIHHLQKEKDLSFGERKIMDNAFSLLVKEISISTKKKEQSVTSEIEKLLN